MSGCRRALTVALVGAMVLAACGGGESTSRARNSALPAEPCLTDLQYRGGSQNTRLLLSASLCDEATSVTVDGVVSERDADTGRVTIEFAPTFGGTTSFSVRSLNNEASLDDGLVALDQVTMSTPPCAEGGLCSVGDTLPDGGVVFAQVNAKSSVVLAAASASLMNRLDADRGAASAGDFIGVESFDGLGYGRFATPRLLGNREFFDSGAGQTLLRFFADDEQWYLPSREELGRAQGALGTASADNPEGFVADALYLSSTVDTPSRSLFVRSTTSEMVADGSSPVIVRPIREVVLFPVTAEFTVENIARPAHPTSEVPDTTPSPDTTTGTDDTVTDTTPSPDTTTANDDSATDTTVAVPTDSVTDVTTPQDPDVIADELATALRENGALLSVGARGEGLLRRIVAEVQSSNEVFVARGMWLSVMAQKVGDDSFAMPLHSDGTTWSLPASHFDDETEYEFKTVLTSWRTEQAVSGEPLRFTPNVVPLDRASLVETPRELEVHLTGTALQISWSATVRSYEEGVNFSYVITARNLNDGSVETFMSGCCNRFVYIDQFAEGDEYEFTVAEQFGPAMWAGPRSDQSSPVRLVPLRAIPADTLARLAAECDVDPVLSMTPAGSLSTRMTVTLTVEHPCIGEEHADYLRVWVGVSGRDPSDGSPFSLSECAEQGRAPTCRRMDTVGRATFKGLLPPGEVAIDSRFELVTMSRDRGQPVTITRSSNVLSVDVEDRGRCDRSNLTLRGRMLTTNCDLSVESVVHVLEKSGDMIERAFGPTEPVDLSFMGSGWIVVSVSTVGSFSLGWGETLLACFEDCGVDLGTPSMNIDVDESGYSFVPATLSRVECRVGIGTPDNDYTFVLGFEEVTSDLYALTTSVGDHVGPRDERVVVPHRGPGQVDVVVNGRWCSEGDSSFGIAFVPSPTNVKRVPAAPEVPSTPIVGLETLANPNVSATVTLPAGDTRLEFDMNELLALESMQLSVRFDDGAWVPLVASPFVSVVVPEGAQTMSVRSRSGAEVTEVTRAIERSSDNDGGSSLVSFTASDEAPEVQVTSLVVTEGDTAGLTTWLVILGVLVLIGAAGAVLVRRRRVLPT